MNLKKYRESLKLTKAQMANYLGVHTGTYTQWENGLRQPGAATQRLIGVLQQIETLYPDFHDTLIEYAKVIEKSV